LKNSVVNSVIKWITENAIITDRGMSSSSDSECDVMNMRVEYQG
jgi:hypothetical protein